MPQPPPRKDDYGLLGDDSWLETCRVNYRIRAERGRYHVEMIFTDCADPAQMLIRRIDDYPSLRKAELYAGIFLRQIRRDPRGNFPIDR